MSAKPSKKRKRHVPPRVRPRHFGSSQIVLNLHLQAAWYFEPMCCMSSDVYDIIIQATGGISMMDSVAKILATPEKFCSQEQKYSAITINTHRATHMMIAFIHKNQVELFDPSGERLKFSVEEKLFPNKNVFYVNDFHLQEDDRLCQTWIYYFLYCRLVEKEKSFNFVQRMLMLYPRNRFHLIMAFGYFLLNLTKRSQTFKPPFHVITNDHVQSILFEPKKKWTQREYDKVKQNWKQRFTFIEQQLWLFTVKFWDQGFQLFEGILDFEITEDDVSEFLIYLQQIKSKPKWRELAIRHQDSRFVKAKQDIRRACDSTLTDAMWIRHIRNFKNNVYLPLLGIENRWRQLTFVSSLFPK